MDAKKVSWNESIRLILGALILLLSIGNIPVGFGVVIGMFSLWFYLGFYLCSLILIVFLNLKFDYFYDLSTIFFASCLFAGMIFGGIVGWKTNEGLLFGLSMAGFILLAFIAKIIIDNHRKNKVV